MTKKKQSPFTETHYHSNDGMMTTVWGPPLWHVLHTISFNYPVSPTQQDKKHYLHFLQSLQYILPCGKCRQNLKNNLEKLPPVDKHFISRDTFSLYIYTLHETVNTMLKKKSGLSYQDVKDRYEHLRARCKPPSSSNSTKKEADKVSGEAGCIEPIEGIKSKCIMRIVPQTAKNKTISFDPKCKCHKATSKSQNKKTKKNKKK